MGIWVIWEYRHSQVRQLDQRGVRGISACHTVTVNTSSRAAACSEAASPKTRPTKHPQCKGMSAVCHHLAQGTVPLLQIRHKIQEIMHRL